MKVKFDRVSFTYGSTEALKDISCEFGSGRTVLVVGHNGSGKSTFLRLMNGILKPSNGEVYLGDTSTREKPVSELARRCALSFQNPDNQLFAQTVAKELRFGIDNIGGDGSLLGPVIEAFHLGEHLESNPYSLTYALRRLVAIAGSGTMNTPILALDEPTAGLSLREKKYLGNLISLLKGHILLTLNVTGCRSLPARTRHTKCPGICHNYRHCPLHHQPHRNSRCFAYPFPNDYAIAKAHEHANTSAKRYTQGNRNPSASTHVTARTQANA